MDALLYGQSGGLNTRDLAPPVTSLTLKGGNAKIDGSFRGVAAAYLPLVKFYRVVVDLSMPLSPNGGLKAVDIAPGTAGNATLNFTIAGLQNNVVHTVRVYIRCTNGWQTGREPFGVSTPQAGITANTLPVGSIVKLKENGAEVEYIVVHQGQPSSLYDASCNGMWLLRKEIFENRQWHGSNVNDYAASAIKAYLDSTFLSRFDANIRNAIKQVKVPYRPGSGTGMNVNSGSNGLSCKIFLLSGYEMGWTNSDDQYFPPDGTKLAYFEAGASASANNKRVAYLNGGATNWWLRSPYTNHSTHAWFVLSNGYYSCYSCSISCGVRPCIILPSNFLLNPTANPDGTFSPLNP